MGDVMQPTVGDLNGRVLMGNVMQPTVGDLRGRVLMGDVMQTTEVDLNGRVLMGDVMQATLKPDRSPPYSDKFSCIMSHVKNHRHRLPTETVCALHYLLPSTQYLPHRFASLYSVQSLRLSIQCPIASPLYTVSHRFASLYRPMQPTLPLPLKPDSLPFYTEQCSLHYRFL